VAYIAVIAFIFAAELTIKGTMEEKGEEGKRVLICRDKIFLTKFHNRGAFLGLGQKKPQLLLGISIGIVLACTLLFLMTLGQKGKRLLKMSMALLLGGAYSNLYDRMKREYVVDYFGFNVKNQKLRSIVFNISDFCIMIGAAVSALRM